jgi:arabinofuranosyltransferase
MNFIHGYGPNFNIDERVQAFTHPLWFLLISSATLLTKNVFVSTFALSIMMSLATWWILTARLSASFWPGMIAGAGLLLSKAFVDYSTSGLENPLSHLLLMVGLLFGFRCLETGGDRRSVTICVATLTLIYLSRPDLVLLAGPFAGLVLWRCYRSRSETLYVIAVAIAPIISWTLFSLFYYGAPLPNTAYAKLGTGFPPAELFRQGLVYLRDSFSRDPITLSFIALGLLLATRQLSGPRAIAIGIVLYLAYVVSIGGDFMTGRFLTAPLLAAAAILARTPLSTLETWTVAMVFAVLGRFSLPATILSGVKYADASFYPTGITDERGFMFPSRGLTTATRDFLAQPEWPSTDGIKSIGIACGLLGIDAMSRGPSAHFIDSCALADPLLARLPAKYEPGWRIGHFERQLPSGYAQSILTGKNLIEDPATRDYWEVIREATRGPLLSFERLKAVARLNLGMVTKPDLEVYREGRVTPRAVDLSSLSQQAVSDVEWFAPPNTLFESAIEVRLPSPIAISSIDVSLHNGKYLVEYQNHGAYKHLSEVGPTDHDGMIPFKLKLVRPTAPTDRIKISEVGGYGQYSIGHLFLNR